MDDQKAKTRLSAILAEAKGFTIPEVIVAGSIMIILCVGTLSVFSYAVKINRGNNLRMQALTVLQADVEYYRSLKFVPGLQTAIDLSTHRNANLYGSTAPGTTYTLTPITTPDGRVFTVTATVTNVSYSSATQDEAHCTFKTIEINAVPQVTETQGWLTNLGTKVTIQRVRSN